MRSSRTQLAVIASTLALAGAPVLVGTPAGAAPAGPGARNPSTVAGMPAATTYRRYRNARFGFSVAVPASFRAGAEPANGDGRAFTSRDGTASMSAWGSNNALEQSPAQFLRFQVEAVRSDGGRVTTTSRHGRVVTVTGRTRAGLVLFTRSWVGSGSIVTLWWTYPRSRAGTYRGIVAHTAASMKPGDLSQGH